MALDTRAAAARCLGDVMAGQSLNQALPPLLDRVKDRDRGLLQQLCYGSLRHGPRLLAILEQLMDKPLRDKDRDVRGLLLCGLYQLEETRIPQHAAVATTVGATAALKKKWARGLTNAILRRYLREKEQLCAALGPAAAASHPDWLYQQLQRQWPDQATEILLADNSQPPMTLRVNTARTSRDAYLQQLSAAGIAAHPGALGPNAVYLETPCDVSELPGFDSGEVSVQDEAAQVAAVLINAKAGERILDACAAPGGKTCHILEICGSLSELVAMDKDLNRLVRVEENLQRLGLQASVIAGDGGNPPAELATEQFDRILVDAPCSATGVIRRHPDVKLLRRESDIAGFAQQQLDILQGLWPLLRPGGCLLYATCSILSQENDQVVQRFTDQTPSAQVQPITASWGVTTKLGRQLLPSKDGADGLFYSLLSKRD
jgi:16S rRNA (cytosine967-C5)-methyltransferase